MAWGKWLGTSRDMPARPRGHMGLYKVLSFIDYNNIRVLYCDDNHLNETLVVSHKTLLDIWNSAIQRQKTLLFVFMEIVSGACILDSFYSVMDIKFSDILHHTTMLKNIKSYQTPSLTLLWS